ncbi:Gag-Pol polyprotein, partial [Plecturocebus cupreus]
MFGRAPPLLPRPLNTMHAEVHNHTLLKSLQVIQSVQSQVHQLIKNTHPTPLDLIEQATHLFQPGDSVLVKRFATSSLTPHWNYSDHTLRTQGGRTDGLNLSHPRQGSPAGGTMESHTPIPRFTKAKTCALFTVVILASLICVVNRYSKPTLKPNYYQWVLTKESVKQFANSITGGESILKNITL